MRSGARLARRATGYQSRVIRRTALLVAVAGVLALPAGAQAEAINYRGKTTQGKQASARTVDGRLKLIKTNWSVPCRSRKGVRYFSATKWTDTTEGPIEQTDVGTYSDSGRYEQKLDGGAKAVVKESISGSFDAHHVAARNTITVKVYNRSGRQIDTCKGTIRFDILPA